LIHVYENKGRRGYFRVYSKKLKTMLIMSKDARMFSYKIRTKFKGRFYGIYLFERTISRTHWAHGREREKRR